ASGVVTYDVACLNIMIYCFLFFFFFSSRRRHTRSKRDWSSDVCSSDLPETTPPINNETIPMASVTHDKVGSLNEENRRSNARIRLAPKINPKMMIQPYNNPING